MNDLISIIIPMYNAEKYIIKLLDSIKAQTYKNLEIIIVNDGSQDNSLSIVEKWQKEDNRIKVITQTNSGASKARNVGIEHATGKYISFLDADDYIEHDMYEKLYKKMLEVDVNILRANYIKEDVENGITETGSLYTISNKKLNRDDIRQILLPYIFDDKIKAYSPLLLLKTDFVKGHFFFKENIHMMEDLLFFLDILMATDYVYFYDFACYHYILHSTSSSHLRKNIIRNYKNTLMVVSYILDTLNRNQVGDIVYKKVHHIYSVVITKYITRLLKLNDEYTITFDQMKELLSLDGVDELIKGVDFSEDLEYIQVAGKYIQEKEYEKLYNYSKSLTN